ncbi:hypothetical protein [Nocardioides sp.]|uniref:hypothetical protein n=1 Tax=Nocardioides sp. TaxID=35761 RepID=UPI00286C1C86|nr:hypothetical protein [Nocardioides sp.]
MTQQPFADAADAPERVRTGEDRVDAVIASVEELADRPVDEHVAVFEQAHDELRRSLDGTPHDDPA